LALILTIVGSANITTWKTEKETITSGESVGWAMRDGINDFNTTVYNMAFITAFVTL
jgi:hypothetical protein